MVLFLNIANPWPMAKGRAASSIVGVILIVGVVVILAATVSVLALGLVEEEEPQPAAAFEWDEYNPNHGVILATHVSGENLKAERLVRKGGAVDLSNSDYTFEAGQETFSYVRPGDTIQFVENEGETRHVITQHEVPDNRPLKPINWSASGPDALAEFRSNFYRHPTGEKLVWDAQSDHIRVGASQADDSWMLYSTTVPENPGNVTVEMRFEQQSFQDSGYRFYLFDQSSDVHNLWCKDSINGGDGISLNCPNNSATINGTASKTLTNDEEFGAFLVVVDMEDTSTTFSEVAEFYNLTVKAN